MDGCWPRALIIETLLASGCDLNLESARDCCKGTCVKFGD